MQTFESGHSASRNVRLRGLALGSGHARCEPRLGWREPARRAGHRWGGFSSQGYDAGILSFFLLVFKYGPLAQMDRARHYECRYWGSSSLSRATTNSAVCQLVVWQTAFSLHFPMCLMPHAREFRPARICPLRKPIPAWEWHPRDGACHERGIPRHPNRTGACPLGS